jgi:hypothetical protein
VDDPPDRVEVLRRSGRIGDAAARELGLGGRRRHGGDRRVSRSSVHNYLRAPDCPGCGAPLTSPHAEECRECTRHLPSVTRAWTRAEALAALREWTREHGRPPTYRDWTPCRERPGRWEAESPRWPSAAVVCAHYAGDPEPWRSALRDAGATVTTWTSKSTLSTTPSPAPALSAART